MSEAATTTAASSAQDDDVMKPLIATSMDASPAIDGGVGSPDHVNIWLYVSYGTIIVLWIVSRIVVIPYVIHLLLLVTAILYAACHMSLKLREEPHPDDIDEHGQPLERTESRETLRAEDAYQFPIIGSISLFSLYLAFKYLDKDWVNFLIGFYFGLVGCFAMTMTFVPFIDKLVNLVSSNKDNKQQQQKQKAIIVKNIIDMDYKFNHSMPEFIAGPSPLEIKIQISFSEIISFVVAIAIASLYYLWKRPWYINNILGICFCLQGIEKFSLGTYKIGMILLIGLFFYDIFWVFGTDVMVTVAKNLDGPIKILFPRARTADGKLELSLLGLGDIVIPGFFLALLLRFDASRANVGIHYVNVHENFAKPYFHSALAAYVAGLGVTMFIMIYFQAAQPALLYLVPACLGSSLGCAFIRGEMKQLFDYSEEQPEEEGEEEETKEADTPKPLEAKKDD